MKGLKLSVVASLGVGSYYLFRKCELPTPEGEPYRQRPIPQYSQHPNKHFLTKIPQTIGIIGSGVTGLCTAKELSQQGFQVEVLEKKPGPGGIWYKNYQDVGLQGPSFHYHLPDYPFPEGVDVFPKLPVMKKWLEEYSQKFGIDKVTSYNSEVKRLEQQEDGTWAVYLANGQLKSYDFLVLATGRFQEPRMPSLEGAHQFKGQVVHSSQVYDAEEMFKGKKVVVVGGIRSAHEIGRLAYLHASEVTSVMRNVHYCINTAGSFLGIPSLLYLINGFAQCCTPAWSNEDSQFVYSYLKPVCWLYDRLLKRLQTELPEELKCSFTFRGYFPYQVFAYDPDFVEGVRQKKIQLVRGSPTQFTENGLVVNGKEIAADVVVMCTGFRENWLGLETTEKQFLYRGVLLPEQKNIAIIGRLNSICIPLVINIQSVWLAEMLRGTVKLPSVQEMKKHTQDRKERFEREFVDLPLLGHTWLPYEEMINELLKDMGISTQRKERVIEQWMFSTIPEDYKTVLTHRV